MILSAMPFPRLCRHLLVALTLSASGAFANVGPEAISALPSQTLRLSAGARNVNLASFFGDPDVTGSVVQMSIRIGSQTKAADIALFDQQKPITVTNFLSYVNTGRYAD